MEPKNSIDMITSVKTKEIIKEISSVVIGQDDLIEKAVVCFWANGHLLLEGVPGLAKTLLAKILAHTVQTVFRRVQFTPDLLPADIVGTNIFNMKTGEFNLRKGPLFTNFFLADEINRTPPKTQSALLEAMEERRITVDGESHKLADPFFVVATQNPVEYEGTYPLPEAQLDRFLMKLIIDYPDLEYENKILEIFRDKISGHEVDEKSIRAICDIKHIEEIRKEIAGVKVSQEVIQYITGLIRATRTSPAVMLGASPRASIALMQVAKTYAAYQSRDFVIPEDIKEYAVPVLRHRIILKPEASLDGVGTDDVIRGILSKVEVPR